MTTRGAGDQQAPRVARRPGAHKAVRPRRENRVVMATGVAMTCLGVVLGGIAHLHEQEQHHAVAVQDEKSTVVMKQTVKEIEESWTRGLSHGEVGLLRVPRFDKPGDPYVAPIVDGWGTDDLARGVGLYTPGAQPGDRGNVVLAGHRITHGSTFADFPNLRAGDTVEVETATHVITYRLITSGTQYRVDDTAVWPTWSTPDPALGKDQETAKHYLTLVTCAETYHTVMRNVAIALEVSSRPIDRTTGRTVSG